MYYYFFDKNNTYCASGNPLKNPQAREITKEEYEALEAKAAAQREEEEKKQLPYIIIALEQEIQDLTDLFTELMVKVDVEELLRVREELKNGSN